MGIRPYASHLRAGWLRGRVRSPGIKIKTLGTIILELSTLEECDDRKGASEPIGTPILSLSRIDAIREILSRSGLAMLPRQVRERLRMYGFALPKNSIGSDSPCSEAVAGERGSRCHTSERWQSRVPMDQYRRQGFGGFEERGHWAAAGLGNCYVCQSRTGVERSPAASVIICI